MKCSMTGQEKSDLLIQVTAWIGLTVSNCSITNEFIYSISKLNLLGTNRHVFD